MGGQMAQHLWLAGAWVNSLGEGALKVPWREQERHFTGMWGAGRCSRGAREGGERLGTPPGRVGCWHPSRG